MNKNIRREIGSRSFTYGNHEIDVEISIVTGNQKVLNPPPLAPKYVNGIHRFVLVSASYDGDTEITNSAKVKLDRNVFSSPLDILIGYLTGRSAENVTISRKGPPVPSVDEHVEQVLQPVLSELDEIYKYTNVSHDISVQTSLDRAEARLSWIDVEDELTHLIQAATEAESGDLMDESTNVAE